jgi:hypothetical protein
MGKHLYELALGFFRIRWVHLWRPFLWRGLLDFGKNGVTTPEVRKPLSALD